MANSTPLPPWDDAVALVNEFFENYNAILPIFHPPTFMGLLGRQYSRSTENVDDPAWIAALNAVLALAQRRRAEQEADEAGLGDRAWLYANNSLEVVLAVLMRSVSLLSVQAVLTLAWFFHGTSNPQPFFFLTAAAVRLSHSAGLHREAEHPSLTHIDREQRLRVFWVALIFDSSASLRTGRPCTHSVNDIDVPLPSHSPKDNLGILVSRHGTEVLNFLSAKARLAVLEGRIYERIFAACSAEKSLEAFKADVTDLGGELDDWSRTMPGSIVHGTFADYWDHQQPHIISLLLAYHTCVITVHSATWQRHFSSIRNKKSGNQDADAFSTFPHTDKCLNSALGIVKLLPLVPRERTSFVWEIIHRPVQAMMLLFICILQEPTHAAANSHLRAMNNAIGFMSNSLADQEASFVHPILNVGQDLIRIARAAIQKGGERVDRVRPHQEPSDQRVSAERPSDLNEPPQRTRSRLGLPALSPASISNAEENYVGAAWVDAFAGDTANVDGPGYTTRSQPAEPGGNHGAWAFDQGIIGMDQLSELSLPFPWSWQDLSNGLLQDVNF
ncbi:Transcription factor fungi [Macrophomina phaseolina MS6]|uniref:Transcription factor fungi n=1 Tax=Macrophomina phaseolina (strain MS6) TaxID=1126212 RepID=K2RA77_MACPH|nr:Transcription factor fungi [Macrophomina phaseolina MS6]